MRVVAGSARGRQLLAPNGVQTRPTSDRVRESIYNALFSLGDPVEGAQVLDLFAGTGALGIEALSRGAASVTFVEKHPKAIAVIEQNLERTGTTDGASVVRADALDWLDRCSGHYDLVLCDPPYDHDDWVTLLDKLARVVPEGLAVLESDRSIDPGAGWDAIRSRRYGGTVVSIVRRRAPA